MPDPAHRNYMAYKRRHNLSRGGEAVSRQAHNLEIAGANPAPASKPDWYKLSHDLLFRALIPSYKSDISIPDQQTAAEPGAHERRAVTREGNAAKVKITHT